MDKKEKPEVVDSLREKAEEELFLRQSEGDHGLRKNEEDETDLHFDDSHEELSLQHVQQGSGLDTDNIQHSDDTSLGADRAVETGVRSGPESDSVQAQVDAAAEVADVRNEGSTDSNTAYEGYSVDREPEENSPDIEQQPRSTIERHVQAGVDGPEQEPAVPVAAQKSQDVTTDDVIQDTSIPNKEGEALFNTAPVAGDDVQLIVNEGDSRLGGQLTAVDNDPGSTIEFSLAEGYSAPDGFSLNESGDWSFDATETAYDHMGTGDSAVFTIPVTITDNYGETDTLQIQITLNGTNDAPVAGADIAGVVDEGAVVVNGQLTATDADSVEVTFAVAQDVDVPAGFSLSETGEYSFNPADQAYDYLGVGDSEVITVPVTVSDDLGAFDRAQIQITVNGTNDGPVAGASVSTNIDEGAAVISGKLNATDADGSAVLSFTIEDGSSAPSGFILNADGSYSFDPGDTAYDHLGAGDVELIDIPVTVTDERGASDTTRIRITVNGTNDAPVAGASVTTNVDEGAAVISGRLSATDADGSSALSFAIEDGSSAPSGFILDTDGSYSFDPGDGAYDHLGAGDVEFIDIPVTVTDEQGASDTTRIRITVNGTNDAPVAGASVTTNVDEGAAVISGRLSATDADGSSALSFTIEDGLTAPSGFILDTDGSYSFDPGDTAYDHLGAGDVELIDIPVTVTDEQGASDTTRIRITVNGTNDAPVAGASVTASVNEDSMVLHGQVSARDVDHGSTLSFAIEEGADVPAGFTFSADGSYNFDPADSAYNELRPGETEELTIPVTVTDELGATTSTQIRISVNGTNETPVAVDDSGYQLQNATLAAELNFDNGVPSAMLGTVNTTADGQIDDAANFTAAKVELSGIDLNNDAGAQTTVSMWVKADPSGGWEMLAASDRYDMVMLNGDIGFNTSRGDLYGADASELSDGEWHHVVGTFTNGDVTQNTLYIDGQEKDLSQLRGTPSSAYAHIDSSGGDLYFGSWGVNNNYRFTGSMDEIKVFNGSLNAEEVNTLYSLETDHVKWDGAALNGNEDNALTIDPSELLANDTDPDGGILSIISVQDAEHGSVEIDADGKLVFRPDENYNGEATFTYTISDSDGGEDTATATLHISSENDLPTIDVVNTITVDEDGSQNITYSVDDIDGDDVTLTAHANNGSVVVNGNGTVTFTPDENYNGDDTITLSAIDSQGGVTTQEIAVSVIPVNDAPEAVDDTNFEPQSATLAAELTFDNGTPTAMLGTVNTAADGQVDDAADFTAAKVELGGIDLSADVGAQTTVSMWVQADPSGGWEMLAASDRYDMVMLNGDIGFNTARGDLFGADASELADGEWHHVVGTFTNGDVTQNTLFIDGEEKILSQLRGTPSSASANIDSSDGNMYFGSWGANNNFRFTGSMDEVKVFNGTLSAEEVNTLHNIESDHVKWDGAALSTDEDTAITIDVLANDIDVDGDTLTITDAGTATDAYGNVVGTTEIVEADGKQQIRFTPNDSLDALNEGENRTISFSYTVSDEAGETSSANSTVNVTGLDNDSTVTDIVGTSRSERLTGTDGQEQIWGLGGNDTIIAGDGDDTVIGGAGSDNLFGGAGDDDFVVDAANAGVANDYHGGDGTDRIVAQDGEDVVINRHLRGSDSIEEIVGEGDTVLSGDSSSQTLDLRNTKLSGIDHVDGGGGNDTIYNSNDGGEVYGGAGSDNLYGGAGDDDFVVDAANAGVANDYHGGDGTDRIVAQDGEDVVINSHLRGSDSIEEIVGEGDTVLSGDSSSQTLDLRNTKLSGIDHVDGGGGNDTIYNSNDGGEVYGGAGSDNLYGGAGDDDFVVDAANAGVANDYHGGDGTDRIVAQDGEDVVINSHLRGSDSIEEIVGEGDTVLSGDSSSQTLDLRNTKLSGIDHVDGGGGNDTIYNSNDGGEVYGGAGSDNLYGGAGDDSFVVDAANAGVANDYHGGDGTDRIVAQDGEDVVINSHLRGSDSIEEIVGEGDTVLSGDSSSQTLDLRNTKLSGIDHVDGGGGNDTIYNSNDGGEVYGGAGSDNLYGGAGDDDFVVDAANAGVANDYHGGDGTDRIVAQDGEDVVINSHLRGSDSIEEIVGEGDTVLSGDSSSQTLDLRNTKLTDIDHVDGGGGNDTIYNSNDGGEVYGGAGSDNLYGGAGDDDFVVDAANAGVANDYHGGDGTDRIVAQDGEDVVINSHLRGSDSIEEIVGEGDTVLSGDSSSQTLDLRNTKLSGIDHVDGGGGNDTIYNSNDGGEVYGGAGSDNLYGGAGDDSFVVDAANAGVANDYHGGDGTDRIVAQDGEDVVINSHLRGSDSIEEIVGEGDTVLSGDSSSQTLDLRNTKLSGIDHVDGGGGNDTIYNSNDGGEVYGGAGSDNLYGGAGDDDFVVDAANAGVANDYHGGDGTDRIVAQDGEDVVINSHLRGSDSIEEIVGEGDTVLSGDSSSQTLDLRNTKLSGIDHVDGGGGNDTIYNSNDGGEVYGGDGSDRLQGGEGSDMLSGDAGADRLYGGDGDDTLSGGAGDDRAWGGEGNDTYVVNPFDGSDYFNGGDGGGWTDAIDISATIANDPDNPWTVEVDGAQVQYELASGALEMNPDTSGVITFGDGTELAFDGLEKIEW